MTYDRDTDVKLEATFTNLAGVATDPTGVTLEVLSPSGVLTTYTYAAAEVTRSATGVFTRTQLLDEEGDWSYRFKGTGTLRVAGWKLITVAADPFA